MSLPPWVRSSTEPTSDELEATAPAPIDPGLLEAARGNTAPTAAEVGRLHARLSAPRRGFSPLWLGAPAALAVTVLLARWVVPDVLDGATVGDHVGVHVVGADLPVQVVPGVWVSGRGAAEVEDGLVVFQGILSVDVSRAVSFAVGEGRFHTERAVFQVDGDQLAVIEGVVFTASGDTLTAGERWSAPVVVAAEPPPVPVEPVVVTVVTPQPHRPARVVAPEPPTVEVPVDAISTFVPEAPSAILAWREVLDARDRGERGRSAAERLDAYVTAWPDGPFTGDALDLLALERATTASPKRAIDDLEARLATGSARGLELHTAAAFVARERLQDCDRAATHDAFVAANGGRRAAANAQAFLGLCRVRGGDAATATATLSAVPLHDLEPEVAAAVKRARAELAPEDDR